MVYSFNLNYVYSIRLHMGISIFCLYENLFCKVKLVTIKRWHLSSKEQQQITNVFLFHLMDNLIVNFKYLSGKTDSGMRVANQMSTTTNASVFNAALIFSKASVDICVKL